MMLGIYILYVSGRICENVVDVDRLFFQKVYRRASY
jgi:hypothetical protein